MAHQRWSIIYMRNERSQETSIRPTVGQGNIARFLEHSIKFGKISHAYGFFGPKGVGKRRLSGFFIQALLCDKKNETPCGKCRNCSLFAQNIHTDVYKISKDQDEKNIGIEKMREMRERIYLAPSISERNIAAVYDAHALSIEAQNSILKILEEPPKNAIIILIADHSDYLLPTLRSRLLKLYLRSLTIEQIIKYLSDEFPDLSSENIERIAYFSNGKMEAARILAADKESLESTEGNYKKAAQFLNSSRKDRLAVLNEILGRSSPFMEQQNNALGFANAIISIIEWQIYRQFGVRNFPKNAFAITDMPVKELKNLSNRLFYLIEGLKKNIAPKLIFEQLIWNIN